MSKGGQQPDSKTSLATAGKHELPTLRLIGPNSKCIPSSLATVVVETYRTQPPDLKGFFHPSFKGEVRLLLRGLCQPVSKLSGPEWSTFTCSVHTSFACEKTGGNLYSQLRHDMHTMLPNEPVAVPVELTGTAMHFVTMYATIAKDPARGKGGELDPFVFYWKNDLVLGTPAVPPLTSPDGGRSIFTSHRHT